MVGPSQNMVVKSVVGWQLCLAARIRKDMGAQPIQTQGDPEKNLFPFFMINIIVSTQQIITAELKFDGQCKYYNLFTSFLTDPSCVSLQI